VIRFFPAFAVPSQAAAEYVAVVAQSATSKLQVIMAQSLHVITDHPVLMGGGFVLLMIVLFGTRR
jgi:hypothetical protein